MSLSLNLSAIYEGGNTGNSDDQSASCSLLSDMHMQYNCTAEFTVNVSSSIDTIESVDVIVTGPYGVNGSYKTTNLR